MVEIQWPHIKDNTRPRAGCSKSLSSKAAGESKPEAYPLGYVEDFDEPRTKLADVFSILLRIDNCRIDGVAGQFLSTLKALEFHEKVEPGDLASQLPNERHRGGCRASGGQ